MKSDVENHEQTFFERTYTDTEIVIGLVGAVGTPHKYVVDILSERLKLFNYTAIQIRVSRDVIRSLYNDIPNNITSESERIATYIDKGNKARKDSGDNSILALGVSSEIFKNREKDEQDSVRPMERTAYIINSLKHPDEVTQLRAIYTDGFYLIGVHSDKERRYDYLKCEKSIEPAQAKKLIERDEDEIFGHGQHTRDTFHLADFFVHLDSDLDQLKKSLWRVLDLIFCNPYITPNFDEYAMFMAFASALRSADLSRQIGAVIGRNNEIIATGANDCPKPGGGLYWPVFNKDTHEYVDEPDGRDLTRGEDSNKIEQKKIIEQILNELDQSVNTTDVEKALLKSQIRDITEYGRAVHAEMEALLFCARNSVDARKATLYTTTFPCHNCAKHIIAAGISKVVYVEPYPKSKAFEFHKDAISPKDDENLNAVAFVPFIGIGPRKFFDLFSMSLSSGFKVERKNKEGKILDWKSEKSFARIQMVPWSYLDQETKATEAFAQYREEMSNEQNNTDQNAPSKEGTPSTDTNKQSHFVQARQIIKRWPEWKRNIRCMPNSMNGDRSSESTDKT
jgi:deoxycytidylate deaminase